MPEFLCTLTPSESKVLLAKATVMLPEVQYAKEYGKIIIGNGSTNAYVAEELFHKQLDKRKFPSGLITGGVVCRTPDSKLPPLYYEQGQELVAPEGVKTYEFMKEFVETMRPGDIFIKGANAVDQDGNVGIFLAHEQAGTMGVIIPYFSAQGIQIIVPVGLEKLVSSVIKAGRSLPGIHKNKYSIGHGIGYVILTNALVVTEIEALKILAGVEAVHLGSGGVGGSEGAVVLLMKGSDEQIDQAYSIVKSIKGEPRFKGWKYKCSECDFKCDWRADRQ